MTRHKQRKVGQKEKAGGGVFRAQELIRGKKQPYLREKYKNRRSGIVLGEEAAMALGSQGGGGGGGGGSWESFL